MMSADAQPAPLRSSSRQLTPQAEQAPAQFTHLAIRLVKVSAHLGTLNSKEP